MRHKTSNATTQTVSLRHCISMHKMVTSTTYIQSIKEIIKSTIQVNLYDPISYTLQMHRDCNAVIPCIHHRQAYQYITFM